MPYYPGADGLPSANPACDIETVTYGCSNYNVLNGVEDRTKGCLDFPKPLMWWAKKAKKTEFYSLRAGTDPKQEVTTYFPNMEIPLKILVNDVNVRTADPCPKQMQMLL